MSTDINSYFDNWLHGVETKVHEAVNKAVTMSIPKFYSVLAERAQEMFNTVVDEFYADYTPEPYGYDRNYSLYNILEVKAAADEVSLVFDPDKMTHFRNGGSGLYDQVFKKGWHGGADSGPKHPSTGTPYWRKPAPYYSAWSRPAAIAESSPWEELQRRIEDYKKYQATEDFEKILREYMSNIKFDI